MGVVISWRPPTVHYLREAMSSVLSDSEMGSWRVGSAVPGVDIGTSGWAVGASDWAAGASSGTGKVVTGNGTG